MSNTYGISKEDEREIRARDETCDRPNWARPKRRVLDFHGDEQSLECGRAGMLGLWEEVRRFVRAAPVHVREAAAGTVRPAAGRGPAFVWKSEDAAAHAVAGSSKVCAWSARPPWSMPNG